MKDDRLAALARSANVARFVSFGPDLSVRHAVGTADVAGLGPSVNVRTFRDDASKATPFVYGVSPAEALAAVRSFAADGLHTIVNETVDVADGGVSGVLLGGVVEFAPGATPRAVEGADAAALPAPLGLALLSTVYGPVDPLPPGRVEFSVHPGPVGVRRTNTLVWEVGDDPGVALTATPSWPNAFSRHLGDKAYGLLVASLSGLPVPRTTVLARAVAPFSYGTATGGGRWVRTCPVEPEPGLFTTVRGWVDPFALLAAEDPAGTRIASVLVQDGVDAAWSGATGLAADGSVLVEGVRGTGDGFMLGARPPEDLPARVVADVRAVVGAEPVRIEWAHDGTRVWVLQLHRARARVSDDVLNPGSADRWVRFDPAEGLDRLRALITDGVGVEVTGAVGVTSHVGDILRKAGVPGRRARR